MDHRVKPGDDPAEGASLHSIDKGVAGEDKSNQEDREETQQK
jgi:hypothetical protein